MKSDDLDEIAAQTQVWKSLENTVVLTGGYFDPIHAGHIRLFKDCPSHCKLIVAVNNDEATLKKKGYVFLPIEQRIEILKSIVWISRVVINPNQTMCELIEIIKPTLYAKGGDVTEKTLLQSEKDSCEKINCKIIYGVGGEKIGSSSDFVRAAVKTSKRSEWGEWMNKLGIKCV